MPKVKIVFLRDIYTIDDYSTAIIAAGTEWEEINAEELSVLTKGLTLFPSPSGMYPRLIIQDELPVSERITTIRQEIKKMEARAIEAKKKREVAKRQRSLQKRANTKKTKGELFLSLAKELGVKLPGTIVETP